MSPRHLNMSLKHFPWKMPRCLQDILTCLSDILPEKKQDTLPEKNAQVSPRHLNMRLRHFAWKKTKTHCLKKMPKCLPDILTCLPHISQTAYLTCPPDIWTCLSDILPRKNAKMSPGYLNMSPRHLNMSPRHLNMSPRHLNMSRRHRAVFCIIRSGGTVEGGKK